MYLSGEVMKETNKEKRDYKLHKLVLVVLLAVLFIAVYTLSFREITAAVR